MPVFVRAGSIVPFGPDVQYIGEKPEDPITLFVYAGADGNFTLYEDDGLTFNYEHGAFSEIPIAWNDSTSSLIIGRRAGNYSGALLHRTFNVVLVQKGHAVGYSAGLKPSATIQYDGSEVKTSLGTDIKQ
jgi:alpha-D-xyloside xylohydrolase